MHCEKKKHRKCRNRTHICKMRPSLSLFLIKYSSLRALVSNTLIATFWAAVTRWGGSRSCTCDAGRYGEAHDEVVRYRRLYGLPGKRFRMIPTRASFQARQTRKPQLTDGQLRRPDRDSTDVFVGPEHRSRSQMIAAAVGGGTRQFAPVIDTSVEGHGVESPSTAAAGAVTNSVPPNFAQTVHRRGVIGTDRPPKLR